MTFKYSYSRFSLPTVYLVKILRIDFLGKKETVRSNQTAQRERKREWSFLFRLLRTLNTSNWMDTYKIGDLTKLFEKDEVSLQTGTSNSKGVQNETSLFGVEERLKGKQVERSDDTHKTKVSQFKAKREHKKTKCEKQDKLPLDKGSPAKIKGKTGKRTHMQPSVSSNKDPTAGFDPPAGIVHESLMKKGKKRGLDDDNTENNKDIPAKKMKACDSTDEHKKIRKKYVPSHTEEEDKRTIFIGNLSLQVTEKGLKKMFREFGEIESIRRRCVPVKDPDQRKRVAAITGEFHPERHNSICYIKFKTEDAAKKALVNNGKLVQNLHIRVDIASDSSMRDTKRTVFVANLPFDVEEEPLRGHFEDCGDIENVRIVRDRKTCLGKGIGYIKFTDPASMSLALKLNSSSFQGRSLRVQRCQYNAGADKSRSDIKTRPVTKNSKTRHVHGNKSKSGQKSSVFQGEKSKKLHKRKKKSNAKSSSSRFFAVNKTVKTKKALQTHSGSKFATNKSGGKHVIFD